MSTRVDAPVAGGIGERAIRPDGASKARGEFSFAGDLWADNMLCGRALRSLHPSARIRAIDIGPALAIPGVHAVLTADDVLFAVHREGVDVAHDGPPTRARRRARRARTSMAWRR